MTDNLKIELTKDGGSFLAVTYILNYPLYGLGDTPTEAFSMLEKEAKSLIENLRERHLNGTWLAREIILREMFEQ